MNNNDSIVQVPKWNPITETYDHPLDQMVVFAKMRGAAKPQSNMKELFLNGGKHLDRD